MKLTSAFQKTWQEIELAFKKQQITSHDLFAFLFCKSLNNKIDGAIPQYDGRKHPNSALRPNFYICKGVEDPVVLFVGKLRFYPEEPSLVQTDITALQAYAHKTSIDAFAPSLSSKGTIEKSISVSPDAETGYFVIGRIDEDLIYQNINSCQLSIEVKAKFHLAFGAVSDDQVHFQYQSPTNGSRTSEF